MSFRTTTRTRLGYVRLYPTDLAIVSLSAIVAYATITSVPAESSLRLLATVPLVLFLPGYALVSALFPATRRHDPETSLATAERWRGGIDVAERLGLSFALSLAIVPTIVLVLPVTEWGLQTEPLAAGIGLGTVALAQVGVVRRLRTPKADRFTVSVTPLFERFRRDEGAVTSASSILLVVAVGAAAGALLVGLLFPMAGGGYSELGLYSEDEDGTLVAGEIPDEVEPGESVPVTLSVENQEGEQTEYTIVFQEQVIEDGEIIERTAIEEVEFEADDEETVTESHLLTPTAEANETVRISALLYSDDVPTAPTNDNADVDTYFSVTVTEDAADDEE
ncbi:DUF1616 domain-containing protein [Natrialbaceae archaeon A-arb3/5]